MTLNSTIHSWFDELQLWLEAVVSSLQYSVPTLNVCRTARENTYNIRATAKAFLHSCKANPIVLKSARTELPLTDPVYLKIHAACCRVAHLSGAGKYINKILEDSEDIQVLSEDSSSAHLL